MITTTTPVIATEVGSLVATGLAPIVIDLGKKKKKYLKDLKRGQGKLMAEVAGVINEVRLGLGEEANNKQLAPVILIYKRKRKGKKRVRSMFSPFFY